MVGESRGQWHAMVLDCFNCLSPLATHPSASSRKWVQFKVAPASRGLWVLPTLIHRCPGHLHCLKAYDKEPEGLQWSDFNPFTWFDVPPEVMRVLAEEEKRAALEDDGWGSGDWEEDWLDDEPKRIRTRPGPSEKGRDSWLKPTLDMGGVWDRMVFNGDDEEVEKRLEMEWQRNQEESRVALKFLGEILMGFGRTCVCSSNSCLEFYAHVGGGKSITEHDDDVQECLCCF